MPCIHHLFLIDPSLGRIDKHSLTTQTLMELFIEGIENKEKVTKSEENLSMYQNWVDLRHDRAGVLVNISWSTSDLRGCIGFQWLPDSVLWLNVSHNKLKGTVDLSLLAGSALDYFDVAWNSFNGTLDFLSLPPRLRYFDFTGNALEGTMNLTHLPSSLEELSGSKNTFSGTLCLDSLPRSLKKLRISNNNFEGPISLNNLPPSMRTIDLGDCTLSGSLDLTQLPEKLEWVDLQNNSFSGDIQIQNLRAAGVYIHLEGNTLLKGVMHLTGKQHSRITAAGTDIQRVYTDCLKAE